MSGKACIISCSDHYSHRMDLWESCLQKLGFCAQYVTSDFDHSTKREFTCMVPGCVQLHVIPYRKNLSVDRILSHRMFAKAAAQYLESEKPDVIVALLPPNFLGHYLAAYKKKHPQTVLIFDIFDLWPETFPSGRLKKLLGPAFSVWAALRDRNLPAADFITTECDLFRQKLGLAKSNSKTVYLCAEASPVPSDPTLPEDRVELCYLGSINNIISIPDICSLIAKLTQVKPVTLHIIGGGERTQELISQAEASGADVIYHGAVFDPVQKQAVMDRCHFGLNIMKSSVCIGLTMKSVDYFRHGIPIINNIPADTEELVQSRGIGIQLAGNCEKKILSMTMQDHLQMRENVRRVFTEKFLRDSAENTITSILNEVLQ